MPVRTVASGAPLTLSSKSITFTGAANLGAVGNLPIFTVTGTILVAYISGYVTTNLAGATATIALGTTTNTTIFIAATTATTLLTSAPIWQSATATAGSMLVPAALKDVLVAENIVGTVATAAVSSGVLRIDVLWLPLGAGGTVA